MQRRVLIVEDNAMSMRLVADVLGAKGFHVLESKDGSDALALVRAHKPDVVLMDIQLPIESGIDLTRKLKSDADLKLVPVIAVTVQDLIGDREMFLAAGFDGFVPKPISIDELLKTIDALLS